MKVQLLRQSTVFAPIGFISAAVGDQIETSAVKKCYNKADLVASV